MVDITLEQRLNACSSKENRIIHHHDKWINMHHVCNLVDSEPWPCIYIEIFTFFHVGFKIIPSIWNACTWKTFETKKFLIIIENVIEIKREGKNAKKRASIVIVEGSRGYSVYSVLMYGSSNRKLVCNKNCTFTYQRYPLVNVW